MGIPVVIVPAGGLPVSVSTNGYGLPMTVATNGFGLAVTQAPAGGGGLAVTGMTFGPTIALSAAGVLETAAVNTVVGTLSVTAGTTGTPVFALVDSAGGKFNISGTSLRTNAALDYETATFHSITVSVTGVTPTVANATFTILVLDVVEPVIQLTGTTVNENATAGTNIGVLSIGNSFTGSPTYTLVDSASGKVAISGSNLNVLGAIDFETTPTFNITVSVSGITPVAPNKVFTIVVNDVFESGVTTPPSTALWGWWHAGQAYTETSGTPTTLATADATIIGSLKDMSGAGRHLYRGTSQPGETLRLKTNRLNSLPAILLNGVDNELVTTGGGPTGNSFSMYVVCNQTLRNKNYDLLIGCDDGNPRYSVLNNTSGDSSLRVFNAGTGAIATAFSLNAYHLVAATVDNVTPYPTVLKIDNNTSSTANVASAGGGTALELIIGRYSDGWWAGDIVEALIYTTVHTLTSGDGLIARQYLDTKYNLGLGLGGSTTATKNIVSDYGAVGDAQWAQTTLSITTNVLTSATPLWVSGDIGKSIVVPPSGASPHLSTITAVGGGGTQVTLASSTSTPFSGYNAIVAWGTDSTASFQAFKTAYQGATTAVTLTIPAGKYLISSGNFLGMWDGIHNITVNATGATLCGATFQIQASAQYEASGHTARTASVTAGATYVTLTTPSEVSRFVIGDYAMMTGFDMQHSGYPTNHSLWEYLQIVAIDSTVGSPTYGRVTFATPLVNSYLSTWPVYNASGTDYGGPATLYAMDPKFNHTCVINGLTVAQHNQWGVSGLNLTFNNCVFEGVGQVGPHPTMAKSVVFNNCTGINLTTEVDKLITSFTMTGCTWYTLNIQSVSVELMTLDSTTTTGYIVGSTRKLVIRNGCNIAGLLPGPGFFGYAHQLDVSNSVISYFNQSGGGALIKGGGAADNGLNIDYTMTGGIITVPAAMRATGVGRWGITGEKMFFFDVGRTIGSFTITDVVDGPSGTTNVFTNWALGHFPTRTYTAGQGLFFLRHPAPVCTFSNVTGCPEVVDLSYAAASGLPMNSYTKRTYTGSTDSGHAVNMWGRYKKIVVTVTTPYTGAIGTVTASIGSSNNQPSKMSDQTDAATWTPIIDLKKTGVRTFDATAGTYPVTWSSTAVAAADTLPSQTEALWCGTNLIATITDVSSSPGSPPMVFTVEMITDQGFATGVTGGGFAGSAMLSGPVAVNGDGIQRQANVDGVMVNL